MRARVSASEQRDREQEIKTTQNYFEYYKILKSFIKNVIPTNKYIHNQTLKFNLKINGKSKNQKWCVWDERGRYEMFGERIDLKRRPNTLADCTECG